MKDSVDRTQLYVYRGDRWTAPELRLVRCYAVKTPRASRHAVRQMVCIRGRNGNMLVETECGTRLVVLARQLRKLPA